MVFAIAYLIGVLVWSLAAAVILIRIEASMYYAVVLPLPIGLAWPVVMAATLVYLMARAIAVVLPEGNNGD